MSTSSGVLSALAAVVFLAAASTEPFQSQPSRAAREEAYRANNLGVALLEQYNYDEAAASFRTALARDDGLQIARVNLALALFYAGNEQEALTAAQTAVGRLADLPHSHYVFGLVARSQGRLDEAVAAFERVLMLDPSDPGSRVNLGQIFLQQRRYPDAIRMFREALDAEPFNVTAAYGLATTLTRSGDAEQARGAMQQFEALRDSVYGVTYAQRYLEQGRYGEAIASTGAEPELVDPAPPAVRFVDATERMLPRREGRAGAARGSVIAFDADADGDLDALTLGASGERFYVNESGRFADATERAGLAAREPAAFAALAADYDNDGRSDLLLLHEKGVRLLRQQAAGRFEDTTSSSRIEYPASPSSASFVDVDHDGDLDVLIAGPGAVRLFRHDGKGGFSDITGAAKLTDGAATVAVAPTDYDDRRDIDLALVSSGERPRLFQNMRDGTFRDAAASVGFPPPAAYSAMTVADVNKDGYTDFFFGRLDAAGVFALSDGRGRFTTSPAPDGSSGATIAQFLDVDNDGLLDLFTASRREARLFRNAGRTWSDVTEQTRLKELAGSWTSDLQSVAFGDLDRDGDLDALTLLADGDLRSWLNEGGNRQRSLLVRLTGRVSNRGGVGSKIDVRAGSLRQRLETSATTPSLAPADVLFGLGARSAADGVRVIWPSGTLQAETAGDDRSMTITELDRKPSSCPYLYTWNGSRFEFVTDFLGGGEIGYWQGPGVWNTPDPDEYVRIPPGALVARGGRYELRVTNELEEALFVDRVHLVAVDHAADVEVFPNEGLGAPVAASTITTTRNARPPAAAVDGHGHDVLARLASLDRQYPDDFELTDIRGYAQLHELRLDLGERAEQAVLLATGWTDYAFSGDNVAAHHRGLKLMPPALEVRSSSGAWRPVLSNIGIPVGRPQTVVVDLRGKLRRGEREIRIVSNMRVFWDRILVDTSGGAFPTRITRVDPQRADLRWRGFSQQRSPDGREPFAFDYDRVTPISVWKTMVGRYTREGDVRDLLTRVDDMFVISLPGDEIALAFDAALLPPLDAGGSRTFLLYADGFSKEMDINSATPHEVGPLPFHAMTRYPYGSDERYPDSPAHREYQARYNTRSVSRSVPPIDISFAATSR